jgi:RNA polymerase sigma-B factor
VSYLEANVWHTDDARRASDAARSPVQSSRAVDEPVELVGARRRRVAHDRRLFERYRENGDLAARDALVERFLPLARHLARRYDHGSSHGEDLVQVASIGLLNAIDRYDPDRGTAFSSFAVPTIAGEIKRFFRDKGWAVRVPRALQERALAIQNVTDELERKLGRPPTVAQIAARIGASTEEVLEARIAGGAHFGVSLDTPNGHDEDGDRTLADALGSLDQRLEQVNDAVTVERLLAVLDDRERTIVTLRFQHDLTQSEIAARVGLSQMHVSRLLRQAIARLRAAHGVSSDLHAPVNPKLGRRATRVAGGSRVGAHEPMGLRLPLIADFANVLDIGDAGGRR